MDRDGDVEFMTLLHDQIGDLAVNEVSMDGGHQFDTLEPVFCDRDLQLFNGIVEVGVDVGAGENAVPVGVGLKSVEELLVFGMDVGRGGKSTAL